MNEGDVALACMRVFVSALTDLGLENACVSPGSRSTAIALALHRDPRVAVDVHLDERSSAFFALGLAKATGKPVAVVCTSGTAAAELFPAVVEARMSRVPLILLTADRPPELRGVGANQTIDQLELYGRFSKRFFDAEVPSDEPGAAARWRALGVDSVEAARKHPPGPVQVNLPFREPLVPSGETVEMSAAATAAATAGATAAAGSAFDAPQTSPANVEAIATELGGVERGVILAGSLRQEAPSVLDLSRRLGWPLIAEPTSGLRLPGTLEAGQFLIGNEGFATANRPDLVLQVGATPTSRAGLAFAASAERLVIVDPDRLVADPSRRACLRIEADPQTLAGRLLRRLDEPASRGWLESWLRADVAARRAVDEAIDGWNEPYEGRVARDLAAAIPDGAYLAVGSSMPVRDLDAYARPRLGLRVLANRGASGIDGFVSTALGVAASGVESYALMGDLTLLHDAGALLWSRGRDRNAVLVVLNNGGGTIFSFLGQRDLPEAEELFLTPHGADVPTLCAAAGAGHERVERASELAPAVLRAAAAGGVCVVEVVVDAAPNRARHAEVLEAVASRLAVSTSLPD